MISVWSALSYGVIGITTALAGVGAGLIFFCIEYNWRQWCC